MKASDQTLPRMPISGDEAIAQIQARGVNPIKDVEMFNLVKA
ncbi:MAG: hypothetical protein WC869_14020 [Phycisphaerae bacterium]|jgi:hypothetical protein